MTTGYLSIIPPTVIWSRAVNMSTVSYPVTQITFDDAYSGTGSNGDVRAGMLCNIYEGETGKLKATLRVAAGAVSGSVLNVEEVSRPSLDLRDNDRLDVVDYYDIRQMLVSNTTAFNKDSRIAYTSQGDNPQPWANSGGPYVYDAVSGSASINFDGSDSFRVDPDAGTLTHSWDFDDGTPGSSTDENPALVSFPTGFRWVLHTVANSDNAGISTTQPVPVFVHGDGFEGVPCVLESINGTVENGYRMSFRAPFDQGLSDLPDGWLVIYSEPHPVLASIREVKFTGYLVRDSIQVTPDDKAVTFEAVSPLAILAQTPSLPQLMRDSGSDWQYVKSLSVWRALWYILYYHATFPHDFLWPDGSDFAYSRLVVEQPTLLEQLKDIASAINVEPLADRKGRMVLRRDPAMLSTAERTSRGSQLDLTSADIIDIRIERNHRRVVRQVDADGITTGESPVFSKGIGSAPGAGTQSVQLSRQIVTDQGDLNDRAGRYAAKINGTLWDTLTGRIYHVPQSVEVTVRGGLDTVDVGIGQFVTITLPDDALPRGDVLNNARFVVRAVNESYQLVDLPDGSAVWDKTTTLSLAQETFGPTGVTYIPPSESSNGLPSFDLPTIEFPSFDIPEFETLPNLGNYYLPNTISTLAAVGTDGYVYRTNDFNAATPTWTRVQIPGAGETRDFVPDPYSPAYINGSGAVNGWIVTSSFNAERVSRITDIFGTPQLGAITTISNVFTMGFGGVETNIAKQNFVVATAFQNNLGFRVWRTTDGVTWTESTGFPAARQENNNDLLLGTPINVSATVPGLARVGVFTVTGLNTNSVARIYKTTDSGASWALDPDFDFEMRRWSGRCLHIPYQNQSRMYYADAATFTDTGVFRNGSLIPMSQYDDVGWAPPGRGIATDPSNEDKAMVCMTTVSLNNYTSGDALQTNNFTDPNPTWTSVIPTSPSNRYLHTNISGDGQTYYVWGQDFIGVGDWGNTLVDKSTQLRSAFGTGRRLVNICGGP